jgi:hypothetical protein
VIIGIVRALDCGALPIERFYAIIRGQDLTRLTKPWDNALSKEQR